MGNCLFDSLNAFIKLQSSHELRLALCRYVVRNPDTFAVDLQANGFPTVQHYAKHMVRNGIDGDHVMLAAACLLYDMCTLEYIFMMCFSRSSSPDRFQHSPQEAPACVCVRAGAVFHKL